MALKLPSFNLLRKAAPKRVPGVPGSKVGTLGNTQINRTGVTKTYATRGAARKAARPPGLLSRLKTKLTKPKPLRPAGKRTFGQMINRKPKFGSMSK